MAPQKSGLFGLHNSNRTEDDHWGKNCFNSSFPAATASLMLEKKIPAVYLKLQKQDGKLMVISEKIQLSQVFNSGKRSLNEIYFSFESPFLPYQKHAFDKIDNIDLVIKGMSGEYLAPLEVKLTVLPDSSTVKKAESLWGSEMVIRAATTSYCALGMFQAVEDKSKEVREIFEKGCSSIQTWDNDFEMVHKSPAIRIAIDRFQEMFLEKQKPLLMQTIWKTQGQSPVLADDAFDIFVWSDFAFSRLFIDQVSVDKPPKTMSRPMRSTARLGRCLWELSKSGKIRLVDIYRQMAFGNQTDKEFAISGTRWRKYVNDPRLQKPILAKDTVLEIIESGYIEKLRPERRFDQTLYFTARAAKKE